MGGGWCLTSKILFCRKYRETQKTQNHQPCSEERSPCLETTSYEGMVSAPPGDRKICPEPQAPILQTFPRAQDPPLSASENTFLPEVFRILEMLFCRISPGRPAEISVDKVNSYCNSWHIAGDRRTMSAQYGALSPDCAALPRVEPRAQPTKGRKVQVQVQVQVQDHS